MVCWRRDGGMVIWIGWGEGGIEDMVDGEAKLSWVCRHFEINEGKTRALYYLPQRSLSGCSHCCSELQVGCLKALPPYLGKADLSNQSCMVHMDLYELLELLGSPVSSDASVIRACMSFIAFLQYR